MSIERVALGREFGKTLADALGLKRVRRLTLDMAVDKAVTLRVERFVTEEEGERIALVCEQYELVPKRDTKDVTACGDEYRRTVLDSCPTV